MTGLTRKEKEQIVECKRHLFDDASRYQTHLDGIPKRVQGTCKWFLEEQKFIEWRKSAQPVLLWVTADAGCGKSVLAKFLIDELGKERPVHYFFFKDENTAERNTLRPALCAILHQMLQSRQDDTEFVRGTLDHFQGTRFSPGEKALWDLITHVPKASKETSPAVCIIDGLDECLDTFRSLFIDYLKLAFSANGLVQDGLNAPSFLITSRPYANIEDKFNELPQIRLRLEEHPEAIADDIERVIKDLVERLPDQRFPEKRSLQQKLSVKADRTFLWVHLVLESLRESGSGTESAIDAILETNPRKLDEVYQSALSRTPDGAKTRRLLEIILASTRPLLIDELNAAVAIRPGLRHIKDLEFEPHMEHCVKQYCGSFVRVIQSRVHFVHQTARQFLIDKGSKYIKSADGRTCISLIEANESMAMSCLGYILLQDWNLIPGIWRQSKFSLTSLGRMVLESPLNPRVLGGTSSRRKSQDPSSRHQFFDYAQNQWHIHELYVSERLDKRLGVLSGINSRRTYPTKLATPSEVDNFSLEPPCKLIDIWLKSESLQILRHYYRGPLLISKESSAFETLCKATSKYRRDVITLIFQDPRNVVDGDAFSRIVAETVKVRRNIRIPFYDPRKSAFKYLRKIGNRICPNFSLTEALKVACHADDYPMVVYFLKKGANPNEGIEPLPLEIALSKNWEISEISQLLFMHLAVVSSDFFLQQLFLLNASSTVFDNVLGNIGQISSDYFNGQNISSAKDLCSAAAERAVELGAGKSLSYLLAKGAAHPGSASLNLGLKAAATRGNVDDIQILISLGVSRVDVDSLLFSSFLRHRNQVKAALLRRPFVWQSMKQLSEAFDRLYHSDDGQFLFRQLHELLAPDDLFCMIGETISSHRDRSSCAIWLIHTARSHLTSRQFLDLLTNILPTACRYSKSVAMSILEDPVLSDPSFNINARDRWDVFPLLASILGNQFDIFRKLLKEFCPDASQFAVYRPEDSCASEANTCHIQLARRSFTRYGETPFTQCPLTAAFLLDNNDMIEFLLVYGADIVEELPIVSDTTSQVEYLSTIGRVADYGQETFQAFVALVLKWDSPDISFVKKCGTISRKTLLHWAIELECLETARLLIAKGADVNAQDAEGLTPLHHAAVLSPQGSTPEDEEELERLFSHLIMEGQADTRIKTPGGQTAFQIWCSTHGFKESDAPPQWARFLKLVTQSGRAHMDQDEMAWRHETDVLLKGIQRPGSFEDDGFVEHNEEDLEVSEDEEDGGDSARGDASSVHQ